MCADGTKNATHGSDSEASAAREIACHFGASAIEVRLCSHGAHTASWPHLQLSTS